jgi:hypothetical protein
MDTGSRTVPKSKGDIRVKSKNAVDYTEVRRRILALIDKGVCTSDAIYRDLATYLRRHAGGWSHNGYRDPRRFLEGQIQDLRKLGVVAFDREKRGWRRTDGKNNGAS